MKLSHLVVSLIASLSTIVQCFEVEDVLKHELDKNEVNITARDNMIPYMNQYRLNTPERVSIGMYLLGEAGVIVGGVIPYCRHDKFGAATFGSSGYCAAVLVSGLVMFNGVLLTLSGSQGEKLYKNPNFKLDEPILSNNWATITKTAHDRGFEINYLYYKDLRYDNGEITLDDFHVVYSVGGFEVEQFTDKDHTYKKVAFKPESASTSIIQQLRNLINSFLRLKHLQIW